MIGAEAAYQRALGICRSGVLEKTGDLQGAIKAVEGYIAAGNPDNDGEQELARLKKKAGAK